MRFGTDSETGMKVKRSLRMKSQLVVPRGKVRARDSRGERREEMVEMSWGVNSHASEVGSWL